jgi:outer membrane lipoprotein LolB
MRSRCWKTIAISLLFVAGCASLPPANEGRLTGGRTIEGRISVRYKDFTRDKEDALSGRFEWTERGDQVELSLLDPLGQTVALIRSDPTHSSITFRDGRKVDGASPEALTQETLGWTVPLRGLTSWLDGRAASGKPAFRLDDNGLRQDNWTIRFVREGDASQPTDQALPKRIDLFYPGPPAEIEMRLVVDQRSGS